MEEKQENKLIKKIKRYEKEDNLFINTRITILTFYLLLLSVL